MQRGSNRQSRACIARLILAKDGDQGEIRRKATKRSHVRSGGIYLAVCYAKSFRKVFTCVGSRGGCEGGIWELILSSVDDVRDYALALERCQNIKRREEAI